MGTHPRGVSGVVKPGQLVAIMGASGAGKSTLLNVLARQNTNQLVISGDIRVNGKCIGNSIKNISAYVQQEDIFIGTLTVKEHLTFQSMLRMDADYPLGQKLKRVNMVLEEMGLKKCANAIIGIPGKTKGISGGEMKRLSFASEILTNPPLLFVDEPTSGLDSFMAETVVKVLQEMACSGRTILCTIHQPASETFNMFARLLLLAEGRTAYFGLRSAAMTYFQGIGYPCPENYNPADFYVHTLAIVPGKESECRKRVKNLCDLFHSNPTAQLELDNLQNGTYKENKVGFKGANGKGCKATLWTQFCLLLWRSWLMQTRDPTLVMANFGQTVFMALFTGFIFLQVPQDDRRLQNISGALFFIVTNSSIVNCYAVVQVFPLEMPVFLRDHGSRIYRTELYFLAKHLSDVPFLVIQTFIYSLLVYWMIGLQEEADRFFAFYGLNLLISNIAVGVGYVVSSLSSNVSISLALAPMMVIPMFLFGGLLVNIDSM
jgi:ABC-type multidrug transport system ATPase subunit